MKNRLLIFLLLIFFGLKTNAQDSVSVSSPTCYNKKHVGFYVSLGVSFSTDKLDIPVSPNEYNSTLPEKGVDYNGYKHTGSTMAPGIGYSLGCEWQSAVNEPLFIVFDAGFSGYNFGGKVTDQFYTVTNNGNPAPNQFTTTYTSQTSQYYYSLVMVDVSLRLYCTVYKIKDSHLSVGVGGHLGCIVTQDNSGQTPGNYYYNLGNVVSSVCVRYSYESNQHELHTMELYFNISPTFPSQNTGYNENFGAVGFQFTF
ncbi:MAG TPA: hypothetical protein VK783_00360 [Bacteroidia bacterium]|jgi:hypothetical protein|nr:hypothetical protein [Bacteroidia bacterium]